MERALDAGAIVLAERADVVDHVLDVLLGHLALEQHLLATATETRLGRPAEVHDDLDHVALGGNCADTVGDLGRQRHEQGLEVLGVSSGFLVHLAFIFACFAQRSAAGTSAGSWTRCASSLSKSDTWATVLKPFSARRRSSG